MQRITALVIIFGIFVSANAFSQEIDLFVFYKNSCVPLNSPNERAVFCTTDLNSYSLSKSQGISTVICNCSRDHFVLDASYNIWTNSSYRDSSFPMGVCLNISNGLSWYFSANTGGGACSVVTPSTLARPSTTPAFSPSLTFSPLLLLFVFSIN